MQRDKRVAIKAFCQEGGGVAVTCDQTRARRKAACPPAPRLAAGGVLSSCAHETSPYAANVANV